MNPDTQKKINNLSTQILHHKQLYYTGRAQISDAEYDSLEDQLRLLEPNHPILKVVGYGIDNATAKVEHFPLMLSLEKTYLPEDAFSFSQKNATVLTDKLDGMALAIEYSSDGKFIRSSTRGNGRQGENTTEQILYINSIPKKIEISLPQGHVFEVRGEVYFPISEFAAFMDRFDSYRNAVPGTFGRKDINEAADVLKVLKFFPYDALVKPAPKEFWNPMQFAQHFGFKNISFFEKIRFLEKLGFYGSEIEDALAQVKFESAADTKDFLDKWFARPRDYQIDGVVLRVENDDVWEKLGNTAHHPRGSLAFKQASETMVTKILDIEENVGRSGKITFRAKLEPVYLSGAKISHATLHNADFIEKGGYAPGAIVRIKRSGEVIPAIVGLEVASSTPYRVPTTCPCGFVALRVGPDLICNREGTCSRRDQESLVHFVQTLNIMGVSDRIVLRLREAGLLDTPAGLYRIKPEDLLELEGFAKKSAENIVSAIQEKKVLPLSIFLAALGLRRGGIVKCQEVAKRYGTLESVRMATIEDLMEAKGWAQKSAEDFVESLREKKDMVDELLQFIEVEPEVVAPIDESLKSHPYFGKNICITGTLAKPREEYKSYIEKVGGKFVDSVTSKTHFLVCNETSGSKKYTHAKKLGVPIITEAEFASRF